jgi:hypothetical protein
MRPGPKRPLQVDRLNAATSVRRAFVVTLAAITAGGKERLFVARGALGDV